MRGKKRQMTIIFSRKNHMGQFYLVAAMIIAVLIAGFVAVTNYAQKKGDVQFENFGEEFEIEAQNVLDYIANSGDSENDRLDEFTSMYAEYGVDKNFYFIFGNSEEITFWAYQKNAEDVSVEGTPITFIDGEAEQTFIPGAEVNVIIAGDDYDFDLKASKDFYFIANQKIEGEKHVITNQ